MNRDQLAALVVEPGPQLDSDNAEVRRIAVAACSRHADLHPKLVEMLTSDTNPSVRRECAEVLGRSHLNPVSGLEQACADPSPEVREAAVNALGELAPAHSVELLVRIATDEDEDNLVRESAVAALGAIGDPRAVPVLLDLVTHGPPQIRRRCIPALTIFDDDEVEAALRHAARDRNPMVREAAQMVVGRHRSPSTDRVDTA